MDIQGVMRNSIKKVQKNTPELLTAFGISGVVTTSYFAAKAGYRTARILESEAPDLSVKEKAKLVWKAYIPAGISGALTVGSIFGAHRGSTSRTAAAVTAYSLTERAFSEYKDKVVEHLGENKEKKIRDELAQEHIRKNPSEGVIMMGGGQVLCLERYTGRYFRSDMEALKKAENMINYKIMHDLYVNMDEFYHEIGVSPTETSNNVGWDSNKLMELEISAAVSESGEPCLAFSYNYVKPI